MGKPTDTWLDWIGWRRRIEVLDLWRDGHGLSEIPETLIRNCNFHGSVKYIMTVKFSCLHCVERYGKFPIGL
jgi:hypothetical protein